MEFAATALSAYSAVQSALAQIRTQHGVAVPLAVESGSRAWGFPSPDSDYDARFVFIRPVRQHLTPWLARDVIELPISGELDVNGWDLAKALKLLLKGNAVAIEWLRSPLTYLVDPAFREAMLAFAGRWVGRDAVARHYLHLGLRQHREYIAGHEEVQLKKLFYALRPAVALRWLRLHPGEAVAPMHLPTLMDECDPSPEVAGIVRDLIARKAVTREMGRGPAPAPLTRFMLAEFEATTDSAEMEVRIEPEARAAAADLYRRTVEAAG